MKTVLLFSGGIDSTCIAAHMKPWRLLHINYGQRSAAGEQRAASAVGEQLDATLSTLEVDCSAIGYGDLSRRAPLSLSPSPEWWPFRNQLLVSLAAAWAVANGGDAVVLGCVKTDGFHVDGTPAFVEHLDALVRLQEGRVRVLAPGIQYTTVELVRLSGVTESLLGWTHSCHCAAFGCGCCRGCNKRAEVFGELNWTH